jgi:hypothetical protein
MTVEAATALTRAIVRYLSLPEAPLLPPAEEGLVLQAYEALCDVMVPIVMAAEEVDVDHPSRPVKAAKAPERSDGQP